MVKRSTRGMPIWGSVLLGIGVFLAAAIGAYYIVGYLHKPAVPDQAGSAIITPTTSQNSSAVTIYMPQKGKNKVYLAPVTVTIVGKDAILDLAIKALLEKGSIDGGGGTVIPPGVKLLNPVKIESGVAVIDLSQEFLDKFSGGSDQEALTLNAIAQTVIHADSSVKKIKILVGGKPVDSLGGHYDLSSPISPDQTLTQPD